MPRLLRWHSRTAFVPVVLSAFLAACADERPTAPQLQSNAALLSNHENPALLDSLVAEVRRLAAEEELVPIAPAPRVRRELVRLGQALAFDPILSGNRDISCMTCHHPQLATGDVRQLSIGQGARGLGRERVHPDNVFIPRNAPPLFNMHTLTSLFWDGRVSFEDGILVTPAGAQVTAPMQAVMEFGAISALPLFPVTSRSEMRGELKGRSRRGPDNELARIADEDFTGIWRALMARLGNIREYREMFEQAYPGTKFRDMTFAHASNAIGGFFVDRFDFTDTPWDRFLAGDNRALNATELRGALSFMSENANCSSCHDGGSFTDLNFHNTALAQFGPGKGHGTLLNDDFGREGISGVADDRYRFRTTPLRNVELTGPFGHAGQFVKLLDFVKHYSAADAQLRAYDRSQIERLLRNQFVANTEDIIATRSGRLDDVLFTDTEAELITKFLLTLTDPRARDLRSSIPFRVPSGLPVERVR
jgi:cytochrome c peroxidase